MFAVVELKRVLTCLGYNYFVIAGLIILPKICLKNSGI